MPKRNPNRRRKPSRKTRAQPHDDWTQHQAACYPRPQYSHRKYADGDVIAAAHFREDSICRQLGYERLVPLPLPLAGLRSWYQASWWYSYTHPFTQRDVVVWFDGVYWREEECYDGREDSVYEYDMRESCSSPASPPLATHREGYHDPILKLKIEHTSYENEHREEVALASQYSLQSMGAEPTEEMAGEWDVAAYFAPYRAPETESCSGFVRTVGDRKKGVEDEYEGSEGCTHGIAMKKAVDKIARMCKERDDWECDFCGIECFCWTVKADAAEVW